MRLYLSTTTDDWMPGGYLMADIMRVWRGDLLRFTVCYAGVNKPDLSWASNGFLAVKTLAAYEAGGDLLTGVASSLDETNPAHDPTHAAVSFAAVFSGGIDPDDYVATPIILDANGNRQSLGASPITARVSQEVFTGNESNVPSGIVTPTLVTGTVLAGQSSVDITVTGMTSTGSALAFFSGVPVSTIAAVCGTGKITVQLGGTVDESTIVNAYILRKTA